HRLVRRPQSRRRGMQCPRCHAQNPTVAKFCGECGSCMATACAACGAEVAPDGRFCGCCGARVGAANAVDIRFSSLQASIPNHLAEKILASRRSIEGERKQVTVLFADMKGSMELIADRDPEQAQTLMGTAIE